MACRDIQRKQGFSLLEMAVVLAVLSLILAGTLGPMDRRIEQRERQANKVLLDQALESLYGFAVTNCRLPCPDCNPDIPVIGGGCLAGTGDDGIEDNPGGECSRVEGNLPWATLGVPELDAWGRRFRYRVRTSNPAPVPPQPDFADATPAAPGPAVNCPPPMPAGQSASFALIDPGNITVQDESGGCTPVPPAALVANQVPAIIVSQGRTPDPAPPTVVPCLEAENADGDTVFMLPTVLTDPANVLYSDDMVIWVVPGILKIRMLQAQKLP